MPDAPDRETLEHKNDIKFMDLRGIAPGATGNLSSEEWVSRMRKWRDSIISDPDWRAWLGEKPATISTIIDLHEWGDKYWFPWERWRAAGFKHGDRVKVTLERMA